MNAIPVTAIWRKATAAAALVLSLVLCFWAGHLQQNAAPSAALTAAQDTLCRQVLAQFGWESGDLISQEEFTLPTVFDSSYDAFLALQLQAGFDLSSYAGKTVTRCTYQIQNYPVGSDLIYADLLLWQGNVVGGDIRSASLDGFMGSLCFPNT